MNLASGNNPCGTEKPDRDASDRGEIILAAKKCRIGMNSVGGNNPCGTKEPDGDESGWRK